MKTPCYDDGDTWLADNAADRHEAMRLCRPCPEITQCLTQAIQRREKFGVWGGRDFSDPRTRPEFPPKSEAPISHGTPGGYRNHLRRKEPMCEPCRQANQLARANWASKKAS